MGVQRLDFIVRNYVSCWKRFLDLLKTNYSAVTKVLSSKVASEIFLCLSSPLVLYLRSVLKLNQTTENQLRPEEILGCYF